MLVKSFSANILKKKLNFLDPDNESFLILGSGFMENSHDYNFLKNRRFFWNSFETINSLKDPCFFFKKLELNRIYFPDWSLRQPRTGQYLKKKTISYGGKFVTKLGKKHNFDCDRFTYYQKFIQGKTKSVQFYISENFINILCICSQLQDKDNFRLECIFVEKITKGLKKKIEMVVKKVSKAFNLKGINSLDFIIPEKKTSNPKLIEINSRPGLSSFLISKFYNTATFLKKNVDLKFENYVTSIIYSQNNYNINKQSLLEMKKIKTVKFTELPILNSKIVEGDPICLAHQKFKNYRLIKKNYYDLSQDINSRLKKCNQNE